MNKALVLLFLPALLWAQSSSENFTITKSVIDAGGGASSSANFNPRFRVRPTDSVGVQTSEFYTFSWISLSAIGCVASFTDTALGNQRSAT
ncbi:MAG: hypothetical protein IPP40_07340 [bacterium]|nr:hypothetical protein [bacterium]